MVAGVLRIFEHSTETCYLNDARERACHGLGAPVLSGSSSVRRLTPLSVCLTLSCTQDAYSRILYQAEGFFFNLVIFIANHVLWNLQLWFFLFLNLVHRPDRYMSPHTQSIAFAITGCLWSHTVFYFFEVCFTLVLVTAHLTSCWKETKLFKEKWKNHISFKHRYLHFLVEQG